MPFLQTFVIRRSSRTDYVVYWWHAERGSDGRIGAGTIQSVIVRR